MVAERRRLDEDVEEGGTPVYDLSRHTWGLSEEWTFSTALLVFVSIFAFAAVLSFYVSHVKGCTVFPEAGVVLLVGIMASGFTVLADPDGSVAQHSSTFADDVSSHCYHPSSSSLHTVHKRHFFSNIRALRPLP